MAKSETFTFICDKCQIETELPKFLVKTMQHCPFCGARHNPPIDEVQKNIKFSIYSYIDDYGIDFVIDTIWSIKIEEGASAWDALVKEYYQDKRISKALTIPH